MTKDNSLTIENAEILFRNFEGRPTAFNPDGGKRDFVVLLDEELAERLNADGWNVKRLRAREEGDLETPFIRVSLSYKNRPPRVILISRKGRSTLPEDLVGMADFVDIERVDLTINPYRWEVRGEKGVKAYLDVIYIILRENPLDLKYADVMEIDGEPLAIESAPDWIEGEEAE